MNPLRWQKALTDPAPAPAVQENVIAVYPSVSSSSSASGAATSSRSRAARSAGRTPIQAAEASAATANPATAALPSRCAPKNAHSTA